MIGAEVDLRAYQYYFFDPAVSLSTTSPVWVILAHLLLLCARILSGTEIALGRHCLVPLVQGILAHAQG